MSLYAIDDTAPKLGPGAWVASSADLIGDVRLGARASVWFGAVIRADNTPIIVGDESNIQDGAIGHSDPGFPLTIGARVTVGHQAILHGCTIADDCLIGMGARILNGAVLEPECLVGAGTLITEGKRFASGSLIVGSPARAIRQLADAEKQALRVSAAHYCGESGALFRAVADGLAALRFRRRGRHWFAYFCRSSVEERIRAIQYTRALGLMYWMSSVSVYSCTGR